ncbi:3-hydroxyanthranilate 3,4-dioxygenase-like [Oratosquilla oratoria]|uniref:3-hydroxyanthranilate 3,4-dioxygenase-like n=1 Tax=Oratosquilla oratoria TaxID=337810 RepID=UPI003F76C92D
MTSYSHIHLNIPTWIEENKKYFLPPVCNKMMHGKGQLKVFYVGGPNIRKDFHLEEGEEFFYMVKGDMNLITLEGGKFKDVIIKEGEVFLLPGKIPHSPQRFDNTVGLVIERERMKTELDCLRYFVGDTTETLFEKWFYCEDLGTQLGPVIKEYFASKQHATGKPIPGTITDNPPWVPDVERRLEAPFLLAPWLAKHRTQIDGEGSKRLFGTDYQSDVEVLGRGSFVDKVVSKGEVWLWQVEGECEVTVKETKTTLKPQDCFLVATNTPYSMARPQGSLTISVVMDPECKDRGFQHLAK